MKNGAAVVPCLGGLGLRVSRLLSRWEEISRGTLGEKGQQKVV